MTELLQWLSLAILFAITGGFAFLYIRHGTRVRPDPTRRHEDGVFSTIGVGSGGMSDGGGSGSGND